MRSKLVRDWRVLGLAIAVVGMSAWASTSRASLAFYDGFDYPLGSNLNSSSNWTVQGIGNFSTFAATAGAPLTFPTLATVGGSALINEECLIQSFTPTVDNFYVSALVNIPDGNAGQLSINLREGWNQGQIAGFGVRGTNLVAGNGVYGGGDTLAAANPVATNTNLFLVAYVDRTAGTISAWNVADISAPLAITPDVQYTFTSALTIGGIEIGGSWGTLANIDEVRIGTTYADVTPLGSPVGGSSWSTNASGNWQDTASWNGPIPNAKDAIATLGSAATSAQTVYSNANVTVGTLNIDNTAGYFVTGWGTLNMQVYTGEAAVNVAAGAQYISMGSVHFLSNTTIDVAAGSSLTVAGVSGGVVVSPGVAVTKSASTGTLTIVGNLTVGAGGSVSLAMAPSMALANNLVVDNITGGGQVDLTNNKAIIHGSTLASVENQIASGSITSSLAATSTQSNVTAIGSLTGADFLALNGVGATFGGDAVVASDILVGFTLAGDINLDGVVTGSELGTINLAGSHWVDGDFNHDGVVSFADVALADAAYTLQSGSVADGIVAADALRFAGTGFESLYQAALLGGAPGAVPEPASLGLLGAGVLGLLTRRKRA